MSDLESGLKEAIENARPRKGREADIVRGAHREWVEGSTYTPYRNGDDKRPAMTAPAVIETITELTKQAELLEGLAFELSDALAGGSDSPQHNASPINAPSMSVFDHMGLELLALTRVMESIERQVKRGLGAVKP